MGAAFANTRPTLGSLLHHTRSKKPIIVILDDPLMDSFSKIKEIYKQNHARVHAVIYLEKNFLTRVHLLNAKLYPPYKSAHFQITAPTIAYIQEHIVQTLSSCILTRAHCSDPKLLVHAISSA